MATSSAGSALPINSLITHPATTPPAAANQSALGEDAFLKLLTTELQNQDPLKPMDDTQSVAQMAQFSALQAQNELKTSFENFQSNFGVLQASSLIGRKATVSASEPNIRFASIDGEPRYVARMSRNTASASGSRFAMP